MAAATASAAQQQQQDEGARPITALTAQELVSVREGVESQCAELQERALQLQRLMGTFSTASRSIAALAESKQGQPVLVPLTESVYAPAALADVRRVTVDIGTGYYASLTAEQAGDYCRRKTAKLEGTLKAVNQGLAEKRRALGQIEDVLAAKMAAARAAPGGGGRGAGGRANAG